MHNAGSENKLLFMSDLDDPPFQTILVIELLASYIVLNLNAMEIVCPLFYLNGMTLLFILMRQKLCFALHIKPYGHEMPDTYQFGM